jgi:hypothetical protein
VAAAAPPTSPGNAAVPTRTPRPKLNPGADPIS